MSESIAAQQQPEKSTYQPGERSIIEIINDLSKPTAKRHLQFKRQGGKEIASVSWYDRVKYLDYFAPGWSNEIVRMDNISGKLIITVRLSIPASGRHVRA